MLRALVRFAGSAAVAAAVGIGAAGAGDRGAFFEIVLTGSELDGPLPQGDYDASLFRGLGLAVSGGRRLGAFRIGGELHGHWADSSLLGTVVPGKNEVVFVAATADAFWDVRFSGMFGAYVGAGVGLARVRVELSGQTYDPVFAYWEVSGSATVPAFQAMFGLTFAPGGGSTRLQVGFRQFETGGLGLRDSLGRPLGRDGVSMPMAVIGVTWSPPR